MGFYMMAPMIETEAGRPGNPEELFPTAIKLLLSRATLNGFSFHISLGDGDFVDHRFIQEVIDAFPHDCGFMQDLVESDAWWLWADDGPENRGAPLWWKNPEVGVVSSPIHNRHFWSANLYQEAALMYHVTDIQQYNVNHSLAGAYLRQISEHLEYKRSNISRRIALKLGMDVDTAFKDLPTTERYSETIKKLREDQLRKDRVGVQTSTFPQRGSHPRMEPSPPPERPLQFTRAQSKGKAREQVCCTSI